MADERIFLSIYHTSLCRFLPRNFSFEIIEAFAEDKTGEALMDILMKFLVPGLLFLLILAFGFWLMKTGRPYNGLLFNAHKLIALGAVVVAVIQFAKTFTLANSPALTIVFLIIAAIGIIALFVSGALLSADKLNFFVTRAIHNIALGIMVIALAVVFYILSR